MRHCGSFLLMLAFAMPITAADAVPAPLPSPTPLPLEVTPTLFRTPADEAAELASTRDALTYVYVINGFDPFHWAHLKRLADRLRVSGYPHTKFGEYFDMPAFEAEYRRIRSQNVHARIVLIGYSAGCYTVTAAAHRLLRDGFHVAMVGYIGGDYLKDSEYNRPQGVGTIVNIRGNGFLLTGQNLIWTGNDIRGAANVQLDVAHFGLPQRSETFRTLYKALISLPTPVTGEPVVLKDQAILGSTSR